jgi:RpiR family carbohydrate utilization transcriptional regulator
MKFYYIYGKLVNSANSGVRMPLLTELKDSRAKRSKSARKLVDYILRDPSAVVSMSIATLAGKVGVSEPTVNRFCTGLGLKGFPDFKLTLAGEIARNQPSIARDIKANDSTSHIVSKIFESTRASLTATQNNIDIETIELAVEQMQSARSIVLCGLGASSSVALDAQHKLLRFDIPVIAHTDMINQRMTAAGLNPQDCLICISYTGKTIAMVEVAKLGKQAGARVIGITAPSSALAKQCDLVLGVTSGENTDRYTPMTSRIAQLALIDVLATRLAINQGADFSQQLRRVKHSLVKTRSK